MPYADPNSEAAVASRRRRAKRTYYKNQVKQIARAACPVLGIPLIVGRGHARDTSPSLDRIDPTKGYVPGNVAVISHKANTMKSNATIDEIRALLRYLEGLV
jgi:hypothetical protein